MTELIVHPGTGEVLNLSDAHTDELVSAFDSLATLLEELGTFRQTLVDEIARRMDAGNSRTAQAGDRKLTVNAPTTETYLIDELGPRLKALVEEGVLDASVVERVIVQPPPKPVEPKVDKRELNKLKGHGNPRVRAEIEAARMTTPARRTLKVEQMP